MKTLLPCRFLLIAAIAGCTSWRAQPLSMLQAPLAPRDRVQLWSRGQVFDVHGVVVRGDSVSAVRFFQPTTCETCVLRFAVRDVDSVRVQRADPRRTRGLAVGLMAATLIGLIIAAGSAAASGGALGGL